MNLAVEIERIVIDDPALVTGRVERLGPLVEAEVERRLRRDALEREPAPQERVEVRPLSVVPASDEALAHELAERVVESLRGGAS